MEKQIYIHKPLTAEETELGEGLTLFLERLTPPIIKLLRRSYIEDSTCISGDIEFLFEYNGEGTSPDDYWL